MNNVKISKCLVLFTIGLFIFTSFLPSINSMNNNGISDEIDQQQDKYDGVSTALLGSMLFAQSFKPSLEILTRVKLFMNKMGDLNGNSILSIRESLSGDELTSVSKESIEINHEFEWIEFDFPDIQVTSGETYYIILKPDPDSDGENEFNYICWGYGKADPYPKGSPYWEYNGSWSEGIPGQSSADYTFITYGHKNNPPYIPSNPYPENCSINIPTEVILNWSGGDPNIGDTATYDVYFGSIYGDMPPFQKIASNISNISINPGVLDNGLTYHWGIVAWDNHGFSTVGPLWYFTSIDPNNKPPNKPSKPTGQTKGKIGQNYLFTTSTTDSEGNLLYYNWSWGDGTYSGWIGLYISGENVNESHSWTDKGNYNIKVKSKDIFGAESDWSDPLAIRMPKTYIYIPIIQQLCKMLERFSFFEKILNKVL